MNRPTLDTVARLFRGSLALVTVWVTVGCGGDASAEAGAGTERSAAAPSREESRTTGTLVIGDAEYAFTVYSCDIAGEHDSPDGQGTLNGGGELSDGTPFQVAVSRTQLPTLVQQEVTLGTYTALDRLYWSAGRVNLGHGWIGEGLDGPAPDGPLVIVGGNTVSAEAAFIDTRGLPDGELHPPAMGRLMATCP